MTPLPGSYDGALVALSVIIAVLAAGAALDLAGRVRAARGTIEALWLAGGAVALGLGIWCMHYTAMLAFRLPVTVSYHVPTVALSLLAAMLASAVALYESSRPQLDLGRLAAGSLVMGAGIATMHYTGMAAMRLPATMQWDVALVIASVAIAVLVSAVALWFAFRYGRASGESWTWHKAGSAVLMGLAIPAMHYTGMAAARFDRSLEMVDQSRTIAMSDLGTYAVAIGTLVILFIGIGASFVSRYREEQLHASEARYRTLADRLAEAQAIAHVGSWEWDIPANVVTWSAELRRILGLGTDAPAGYQEFLAIAHPDDRARLEALVADSLRTRQSIDFEWRVVRPDGTIRDLQSRNVVIPGDNGQPAAMAGTCHDVTDYKRAEQALAASERYYRALSEHALDLTTLVDADGFARYASASYQRVLGYRPEDVIGRRIFDLIHPDDLAATLAVFTEASGTPGATGQHEFRFRHHDGSWRTLAAVGRNLFDDPVIRAAIINARDVTEQKAAADHERTLLRELQQAISEVRVLEGILPICASCKRIRDGDGTWEAVESYVRDHSNAEFTHGLCPDCAARDWGQAPR